MNARQAYILSSPRGQYYEEIRRSASEGKHHHVFSLMTDDYLELSENDKLERELNFWPALMEDFRSNGYKVTFDKERLQILVEWNRPFAGDKGLDEKLWGELKKELLDHDRANNPIFGSAIERTIRSILENQIKEKGSDVINGMMKECLESLPMIRLIAPNLLGGFFQSDLEKSETPEEEIRKALRDLD